MDRVGGGAWGGGGGKERFEGRGGSQASRLDVTVSLGFKSHPLAPGESRACVLKMAEKGKYLLWPGAGEERARDKEGGEEGSREGGGCSGVEREEGERKRTWWAFSWSAGVFVYGGGWEVAREEGEVMRGRDIVSVHRTPRTLGRSACSLCPLAIPRVASPVCLSFFSCVSPFLFFSFFPSFFSFFSSSCFSSSSSSFVSIIIIIIIIIIFILIVITRHLCIIFFFIFFFFCFFFFFFFFYMSMFIIMIIIFFLIVVVVSSSFGHHRDLLSLPFIACGSRDLVQRLRRN